MTDYKCLLFLGALMGFLSVFAGAFGAHFLKQKLSTDMLNVFEIAARYHMAHALAICLVAILLTSISNSAFYYAGWLFFAGSILFSGSLYLLALTNLRWLGMITPIGGMLFLAGWLSLAFGVFKNT